MTPWDRALSAARVAIARLELVSNGTTAALNSEGGGHPGSKPPPPADAPWRELRKRRMAATTIEELEAIRAEAHEAWKDATGMTTAQIPRGEGVTLNDQVLAPECVGWDAKGVGEHLRIDPALVRRIRERNEVDPETGRSLAHARQEAARLDAAHKHDEVLARRRKGHTTRQIADALDLHQTQVMRIIRRAA